MIVDGRVVVRDGVPVTLDPESVRAYAAEALPSLVQRAGI